MCVWMRECVDVVCCECVRTCIINASTVEMSFVS